MQIDVGWIKKELDAGREVALECVNADSFLKLEFSEVNKVILNQEKLVVKSIYKDCGIHFHGELETGVGNYIHKDEFKYFRIKRPDPTFDDLIDVAVQAYKDGVLSELDLGDNGVYLTGLGVISSIGGSSMFQDAINDINSLYTETFVIESEEDYHSLKGDASIKLLNGETIKRIINYSASTPEFSDRNGRVVRLSYLTLKGATVTQNKARKEII